MKSLPLYVSRDHYFDWLIALEFGRVLDGQPGDHFLPVDESCAFVLDGPGGDVIGLSVGDLRDYDPAAPGSEALWCGQRFDVPLFGLRDAYAGEVILASQASLRDESTMNRCYFDMAVGEEPEEAIKTWRLCLESGDSMAHYGLGCTLLALNRPREAYRHLRAYVDIARWNAWAWCWLGRACVELGEREEAIDALVRARALEGEAETDAEQTAGLAGAERLVTSARRPVMCQITQARRDPPLPMPFEPDHRLLTKFVAAQERGDSAEAAELWEQLAVNNFDRVKQIVKAFQFSPGKRLPPEDHGSAASEAYLRVISMGASFRKREPGSYYAALYRCVHNACLDYGRKELRHQKRSRGSVDERYEAGGESGPYDKALAAYDADQRRRTEQAIAAELARREAEGLVNWAIGRMQNPNHREVLEMTYLRQLPADAIAEQLGITIENLYQRRSRGLKELEKILRDLRS